MYFFVFFKGGLGGANWAGLATNRGGKGCWLGRVGGGVESEMGGLQAVFLDVPRCEVVSNFKDV